MPFAIGAGRAYWLPAVDVGQLQGNRTVAQINALGAVNPGDALVVTDSGTLTLGSLGVNAGDLVEFDGAGWQMIQTNSGGFPPAGTTVLLGQTIIPGSPYTNNQDEGTWGYFDGTSLTAILRNDFPSGAVVSGRNPASVIGTLQLFFVLGVGVGYGQWTSANPSTAPTPSLSQVLAVDNETDGTTANSIRVLQSSNISNIFFETDIGTDDDFGTGDSWIGIRGTRTLTLGGIRNLQFITYAGQGSETAYSGEWDFADDSVGITTPKVVMRMRHAGSDLQISALRASTTALIIGNGGSSTGGIRILPSGATRTIHTTGANALGLGTNNTTYLTISSAGDVTFGGSSTVTIDTLHGNGDGSDLGATASGDRWDRVYLRGYINWQSSDLVNPTTANEVNLCPSAGALYMAFDASERLGFFGLGSGTCRIQATVAGGVLELAGAAGVMVSRLSNGVGFFGTTPVAQQTAFTQTYATATTTHAARTAATLTDNSGGTANTTIAAITDTNNAGSADLSPTRDAIADLAACCNALLADQQNTAQVLNQVIDHLQAHGLFA